MEVSGLSPNAYMPNPSAGERLAAARPKEREGNTTRETRQEAEARAEALRAARETLNERPAPTVTTGGSIEFEQDEGTRVMKVLDSKDVLIYQVPPKGQLTLIKAEEAAAREALALV